MPPTWLIAFMTCLAAAWTLLRSTNSIVIIVAGMMTIACCVLGFSAAPLPVQLGIAIAVLLLNKYEIPAN